MTLDALDLSDLLSDPTRPVALSDVARVTDPLIPAATWQQWNRRGLLPVHRWTVGGLKVWSALDVLDYLASTPFHVLGSETGTGRAVRCGRTCPHCAAGDRARPLLDLEGLRVG